MANITTILSRVNAHVSALGEESTRIYLPDIFPMVQTELRALTDSGDARTQQLLTKTFDITLTANPFGNVYTGSLTAAQAAGLKVEPPFMMAGLGANGCGALFRPTPFCDDDCQANLMSDRYTVIGTTLYLQTNSTVVLNTTTVSVTGRTIPVVNTGAGTIDLPDELVTLLVANVAMKLGELRQMGSRQNG